jgi:hypothetical protein
MKIRITGVLFILAFAALIASPALGDDIVPRRYFGPGPGYPDYASSQYFFGFGSEKYFLRQYPEEQWGIYGYGTGHMGMGYGPYIYGGRNERRTWEDRPDLAMPVIRPKLRWLGGNAVSVKVPSCVLSTTIEVIAFNGAVLTSEIITTRGTTIYLPEGATSVRLCMCLPCNGFSAQSFSIIPVN